MIRIASGDDYAKRYSETVAAIRKEAGTRPLWAEPTSTYIFESTKTAQDLCDAIYYGSPLLDSKDVLVVVNLSIKSHAQRGTEYPATLNGLMAAR